MVTTELAHPTPPAPAAHDGRQLAGGRIRQVLALWGALWAATALGMLLALPWPAQAPAGRPHPSLHPTLGAIASILATNIGVLIVPFALVALRFQSTRGWRLLADTLVLIVLGRSAITIGLALGHNGTRLLPYLPQLPVEYAAAALAAGVWIEHRREPRTSVRSLASQAVLVLALLAIAAALEVLATPHAR